MIIPKKLLFLFLFSLCVGSAQLQATNRPNILWIFVEDLNPFLSCYGHSENPTPNIDRLAQNGVLFENCFSPSPVCSPTRSALVTGNMPTTIGVHNHHSSRTVESGLFLKNKTIPELFKSAGYFTFNDGKDDYNFIYNRSDFYTGKTRLHHWYTFSGEGSWNHSNRRENQPFFGQIQLEGGKHGLYRINEDELPSQNRINPGTVEIPPYYPDIPEVRKDWERHYDCARVTDREVKAIVDQLEKHGLLENTVIFFFSDHGYKGYRHKQFCYDSGLHVPLIIADFRKQHHESIQPRKRESKLVSLLDVSATSLALAGIEIPQHMESLPLLGSESRDFVISTRDRCDFSIDRIRSIRTPKYRYIRNFIPNRPYMQPSYRDSRAEIASVRNLYLAGKLNPVQAQWWGETKPEEELYDVIKDPHQIHNLAGKPEYRSLLIQLREQLTDWIETSGDKGQIPEHKTPRGIENLRFIKSRWGDRCVNPEYRILETNTIPGSPRSHQ